MLLTENEIRYIAPRVGWLAAPLADSINKYAAEYDVTGNRLAHFLAQTAHESMGFTKLEEIWGPTTAQKKYEGRRDLGNTRKGDGYRYRGRGIIQLTGRANYREYGKILGLDLENDPDLAAEPDVAVRIALEYWRVRGLNIFADVDDILTITRKINGGLNGIEDRRTYLERAKRRVGSSTPDEEKLLSIGARGEEVKRLQAILKSKGYPPGRIDGVFGSLVRSAVMSAQADNGDAVTGATSINSASEWEVRKLDRAPLENSRIIGAAKKTQATVVGMGAIAAAEPVVKEMENWSGLFERVKWIIDPILNLGPYKWVFLIVAGGFVVYQLSKLIKYRTEDHDSGRTL